MYLIVLNVLLKMMLEDLAAQAKFDPSASGATAPTSFDTLSLLQNQKLIFESRMLVSIVASALAGALGFTGWLGLLCWFCSSCLLVGTLWFVKLRVFSSGPSSDFLISEKQAFTEGLMSSLTSFVLVWSLSYAAVHIYLS